MQMLFLSGLGGARGVSGDKGADGGRRREVKGVSRILQGEQRKKMERIEITPADMD